MTRTAKVIEKCFRCGDPNHLIGECPKPPKDKNQRAFVEGSWSDNDEEVDEKICLRVDLEPDEWIKDRGCSKHITGNRKLFSSYKAYNKGNVIFGSNLRGNIIGKGQICDNKCRVTFSKYDSEITKDDKVIGRAFFKYDSEITKDGKVIGRGIKKKGLYVMKLGNKPRDQICLATIDENSTLWHRRLCHTNMRLIQSLASKELVRNLPKLKFDQYFCDACKIRKQAHVSHKAKNIVSTTRCLELLHMDLFGPSAIWSYKGNRYTLVIVDDYLREFDNEVQFEEFCNANGITHNFSALRTPQLNGVIERKNMTLQEMSYSQNRKAYIILNKRTRKVEEPLNVTFDETPPSSDTSPLVDDDLDEDEAIKITKKKNLENDIVDETLEIDKIVNIKESRNHPLENVIGNLNQRTLRLRIKQMKDGIFFNQSKYIKEMLKKYRLEDSKPIKTPMSSDTKLTKDEECESVDSIKYRGMIGSLLYLTASRPDIMFSICLCARFQEAPKPLTLKRLNVSSDTLKALRTLDYGILRGPKQTTLAISTTEAKYVSTEKACQQALWMKQALIDYDVQLDDVSIMCDNKGAIDLSKNSMQHSRIKHIKIRHHFLHDNVQKGHISIKKVPFVDNIADILTKPLKRELFNYLRLGLGMMEHISEEIVPRFVLEFYSQLSFSYNSEGHFIFNFVIQNKSFSLTLKEFGQILKIPFKGHVSYTDTWLLDYLSLSAPSRVAAMMEMKGVLRCSGGGLDGGDEVCVLEMVAMMLVVAWG
uniref:Retrovirus-related Pol polyprotein from transposon TNT 1-94 n=1 Tax=Tanacetum cinerariifolium TaxID=118510 RepID=A0A699GKS1_TANCI|nr:hypothetical protein [Tanacetum cinerariifolium]